VEIVPHEYVVTVIVIIANFGRIIILTL
jgi:hypothetical protein